MGSPRSKRDRMQVPSFESVGHLSISRKLLVRPPRCPGVVVSDWVTVPALGRFDRVESAADFRVVRCLAGYDTFYYLRIANLRSRSFVRKEMSRNVRGSRRILVSRLTHVER
jgi:hypothetical protein